MLVAENPEQVERARIMLARMGYDRVRGYLAGGIRAWEMEGRPYDSIPAVHVDTLTRLIQSGKDFVLLDVRTNAEVAQGKIKGALHIPLSELPDRLDEVPRGKRVITYCSSGRRAMIAASILKRNGFEDVEDNFGSMSACRATGCPTEAG